MEVTSILFATLADKNRRRILLGLCEEDSITVLDDIRASSRPRGSRDSSGTHPTGGSVVRERADRFEIELYHHHLPKLETEGFVEWDRQTWSVSKGPKFGEIEPVLQLIAANAEQFPGDL